MVYHPQFFYRGPTHVFFMLSPASNPELCLEEKNARLKLRLAEASLEKKLRRLRSGSRALKPKKAHSFEKNSLIRRLIAAVWSRDGSLLLCSTLSAPRLRFSDLLSGSPSPLSLALVTMPTMPPASSSSSSSSLLFDRFTRFTHTHMAVSGDRGDLMDRRRPVLNLTNTFFLPTYKARAGHPSLSRARTTRSLRIGRRTLTSPSSPIALIP